MSILHDETYLLPKKVGPPLAAPQLQALVSDLIKRRTVVKPYAIVTGKELPLPFSRHSPLADVLLYGKKPPRGMRVAYRGDDPSRLLAALSDRTPEDVIVHFADLPPFFEDIPEESSHAVMLFALRAPRALTLRQKKFDENLREIEGSGTAEYRICNGALILGTDLDTPKYHPIRNLGAVLKKHLGSVETQRDILF